MQILRGFIRFFLFLGIMAIHILGIVIAVLVARDTDRWLFALFGSWAKMTQYVLGIKVSIEGQIPSTPALYMPNHRSYIDVVFFPPFLKPVYVAKSEIRKWPVIGYGAKIVRTIFVNREDKNSRRNTRDAMKNRFENGYSVIVYPEGTTYKAPELGEFYPGMFYVAASGDIPIVPVAIEYKNPDDAWVGDDVFIPHFLSCFGKKHTHVRLTFGDLTTHEDGEILRQKVHAWIGSKLREIQKEWGFMEGEEIVLDGKYINTEALRG